ncbi:UNVERIFIED_CONTAM: hypothetical protein FKN15_052264 [Acipenser sinensis]
MATKRNRAVLAFDKKLEIVKRLKKTKLALEFGLGKATVSDLKQNSDKIESFNSKLFSTDRTLERKCMKSAANDELDNAVYLWFAQKQPETEPTQLLLLKRLQDLAAKKRTSRLRQMKVTELFRATKR